MTKTKTYFRDDKRLTIDLREQECREYCNRINKKKTVLEISIIALVVWLIIALGMSVLPSETKAFKAPSERELRVEACTIVYMANKDWVDSTYIHTSQDVITRCATMMTLIGAYESDYFNSERCLRDNNCFGIKDWDTGEFKIYKDRFANYLDFADKYLVGRGDNSFRGHKNRDITAFVYAWSMTDRANYINFVESKYWEVYNDLKSYNFIIR